MPTTVTASNGNTYHLFQLSTANSVKSFEESIGFTVLRNELSDGYRSSLLFGSNTGVRRWSLKLPTLAHSTLSVPTVTGVNGTTVSREEYVWELYQESMVTGQPFAIQSEHDSQYYLVEFVNDQLTYAGFKIKLYETGIELKQVRVQGVTLFDPTLISGLWKWLGPNGIAPMTDRYGATTFTKTGDADDSGLITQNGLGVTRMNSSLTTGRYSAPATTNVTIYDLFLVLKVRETTFGQTSGLFTDNAAATANYIAFGQSGQANVNFIGTGAWLNGGAKDTSTPIAINMNEWIILRFQNTSGNTIARPQIGQRDSGTTGPAEIDIGDMLAYSSRVSEPNARMLTEYLSVKWAIGG